MRLFNRNKKKDEVVYFGMKCRLCNRDPVHVSGGWLTHLIEEHLDELGDAIKGRTFNRFFKYEKKSFHALKEDIDKKEKDE